MTEELEQLLKNLKLRRILEINDEQLRSADKDDISYSDCKATVCAIDAEGALGSMTNLPAGR